MWFTVEDQPIRNPLRVSMDTQLVPVETKTILKAFSRALQREKHISSSSNPACSGSSLSTGYSGMGILISSLRLSSASMERCEQSPGSEHVLI